VVAPKPKAAPEFDDLPRVPVELYDLAGSDGQCRHTARDIYPTPPEDPAGQTNPIVIPEPYATRWQLTQQYRAVMRESTRSLPAEFRYRARWRIIFEQDQEFQAHIRARKDNP
jgi:hypothetical protein